jgi:hypothetical protein
VRLLPQLRDYGPDMAGHALRVYQWLQYGSSVVGLAVVLAALALWLRHAPVPASQPVRLLGRRERGLWLAAYVALPIAAAGLFTLQLALRSPGALLSSWGLGTAAVISMRATALSLLLVSVLIRARLAA